MCPTESRCYYEGGFTMGKHHQIHKRVLKNSHPLRDQKQKTGPADSGEVIPNPYRELQAMLSPFWAWRGK